MTSLLCHTTFSLSDPLALHYQFSSPCLSVAGLCHSYLGERSFSDSHCIFLPLSLQLRVLHNDFARYNMQEDDSDALDQVRLLHSLSLSPLTVSCRMTMAGRSSALMSSDFLLTNLYWQLFLVSFSFFQIHSLINNFSQAMGASF